MNGFGEFTELFDAGRALIEHHQRRINARQILDGVGTTETAKLGQRGRGRTHRKQVQNPATERVEDVGQLGDQIAQFARGRNDRVALGVELFPFGFPRFIDCLRLALARAEHAGERTVDGVGCATPVRLHTDAEVRSVRPVLPALGVGEVSLGPEESDFGEWHGHAPAPVRPRHFQIAPGGAGRRHLLEMRLMNLFPQLAAATNRGPEQGAIARLGVRLWAGLYSKSQGISHEANQSLARGRSHGEGNLGHRIQRVRRA